MDYVRSRYLLLGDKVYLDRLGRRASLAYSARKATLFALDEATADQLRRNAAPPTPELAAVGAIVPRDEDELGAVLAALRSGSDDPARRGFTILVTGYCNMACGYCGQEHHRTAAQSERVARLADRVEATIAGPATRDVEITWFGGEPMLALRLIKQLSARFIAAAREHSVGYSARMATNGSLLTVATLAQLHHDCHLNSMEVTIDGPQAVHDRRRLKRNGTGSYRHIVSVLGEAVRAQVAPKLEVSIRVNVDTDNEDSVSELITDLAAHGLASPQVSLHPVPVHSWGNDISAIEIDARRYAALEAQWLRQAQSLGLRCASLPTALKRTTCRATSVHGEIVDLHERVYSCSEHPLVPGMRDSGVVATVTDLAGSAPRPPGRYDGWYDQVGEDRVPCGRCPLLPVCGGSCPKLWDEGHLPCPSMRFNWADRLDLAAARLGYKAADG
ncbi:radical SAM/SPASM domain-containing protein [Rhizocola hellebori]|uniref:Radical SAM/SPASM domain-containing protein n=1 Tax=Rhizocola hellebori TaxID=1392758 RepID=A0A8J3QG70_9ACTN|nr:radical SAM protein [Rhizocola hellebori]GIH09482.1 radical SAM/SPASM domain-containing protein [Rhizocola hellebori]